MAADLDLGKQVGPLPLGAWIAVVAGGLGLAWYVNRNSGGGGGSGADSGTVDPGSAETGVGGGQMIYEPPQTSTVSPDTYDTNDAWGRAAVVWLISEGVNPLKAQTAITKYLGEQSMTAEEQALVTRALGKLGPPPSMPNPAPVGGSDGSGQTGGGGGTTTPPPPSATLTAPKNLRTWGHGPTKLTVPLQWDAVPGATSYRVYRSGVSFNIGASVDTKFTVGGLLPGKSYTFHVRAMKGSKLGPSSASKTFKTKK